MTSLAACGGGESDQPHKPRTDERTIVTIQSYVYASPDEPTFRIAQRVRDQIKSAFGGLKSMHVLASNKEVTNGLDDKLYREPLVLSRQEGPDDVVMRVWFRYADEVFAPASAPRGAPILVGGLHRQDDARAEQILTACTPNTARERELKGRLQTAFDGSLATCQEAILAEQAKIDAARAPLDGPDEEVVLAEASRTFVPVIARLFTIKATQQRGQYPRFEDVVPQAGRAASSGVAGLGGRPRSEGAGSAAAAGDTDAVGRDEKTDAPVVVAGVAAPADTQQRHASADEPNDPDAPPEINVPMPVVAGAATPPKSANPAMPQGDAGSSFSWEDLGDKRFWVMWLALFALYPLLKRRQS